MAVFIHLTRKGPPEREVLVNVDRILLVQAGQHGGSTILFGHEHTITFVEEPGAVHERIAAGPYVMTH
ncbi:hypothetical protein [Bradyrhizobium sp. Bra78]|uniref:hypothetical protein n=1 Tax=Bradyrhizobium sp. Bra78 TaxID=2926010 RepID=UPI0021C72431|nr:hypothetical protein [Bradyrhizobium sp. Bra78]